MRNLIIACAATLPLLASGATAYAAYNPEHAVPPRHASGALQDARDQVGHAAKILHKMVRQDPGMRRRLHEAKAVFVMTSYGRGGLVVGGSGSPGVLMVRHDGRWAGPALFNVGSVSVGAQVGGEWGSMVWILDTHRALRQFEQTNNFSLKSGADLTFAVWSAATRAQTSAPDVVVWSDFKGAYAGADIGATDINYDEHETGALYGHRVSLREIVRGQVHTAAAQELVKALPA